MTLKLIAAVVASLALIPAAPASAGTLTTQNSCKWSYDGEWRHLDIDLTGTGSLSPVAPGSGLSLTRTSVRARLPEYLAQYGYGAQILRSGDNEIPAKVWVALTAPDTPQGVQVFGLDAVGRTSITENPDGTYKSSTPIDVTVPIPDSAWTAGAAPVGFRQAAAGTLPRLPVGPGGASVTPLGSIYISATIGALKINIDCQPGAGEGANPPVPSSAGAFETVAIDAGAPRTPAPAIKKPALTLRTTKLKASGRRVSVALACANAPCKGTVTAKYAGGTAAKAVKYSLAAGARKTYKLTLSAKALKSLKQRSLQVSVKITTAGGETVSKKLRLRT